MLHDDKIEAITVKTRDESSQLPLFFGTLLQVSEKKIKRQFCDTRYSDLYNLLEVNLKFKLKLFYALTPIAYSSPQFFNKNGVISSIDLVLL